MTVIRGQTEWMSHGTYRFRHIFSGFWRDNLKPLQYFCQTLLISYFIDQRKLLYWRKFAMHNNNFLLSLSRLVQNRFYTIDIDIVYCITTTLWFKKNAPTLADYNYDPVQSILIIFSKLFVSDYKSCLVVKFSTSPHICCHYTLWNTVLYFALITLLIARNAPTSDHHITLISVKEF